jgi:hypothetical protein
MVFRSHVLGLLSIPLVMAACSQRAAEKEPTTSSALSLSPLIAAAAAPTLSVGGPCGRTDGWQAPEFSHSQAAGSTTPAVTGAQELAAISVKQPTDLAPGVGYCIPPGDGYPNGYFTMNCSQDSDCPGGTFCEGIGQCRRPCAKAADCGSGMACTGASPRAFCQGTADLRQ